MRSVADHPDVRRHVPPLNREGFWCTGQDSELPQPMTHQAFPEVQRKQFLAALHEVETEVAETDQFKGFSRCRVCGKSNGSATHRYMGWTWPSGYAHYVREHGVMPSLAFRELIEDRELA